MGLYISEGVKERCFVKLSSALAPQLRSLAKFLTI